MLNINVFPRVDSIKVSSNHNITAIINLQRWRAWVTSHIIHRKVTVQTKYQFCMFFHDYRMLTDEEWYFNTLIIGIGLFSLNFNFADFILKLYIRNFLKEVDGERLHTSL